LRETNFSTVLRTLHNYSCDSSDICTLTNGNDGQVTLLDLFGN
jgi:hypothetical protein